VYGGNGALLTSLQPFSSNPVWNCLFLGVKHFVSLLETFRFSVRNKWFRGMKQITAFWAGATPLWGGLL